jgi:hypothetical protein
VETTEHTRPLRREQVSVSFLGDLPFANRGVIPRNPESKGMEKFA